MKFPLPDVSEEDRGLLKGIRSKRKYEKNKYSSSNQKKEEGASYCMVTITAVGGAIIIIATIVFTVMEIVNNKHTRITAYPVDYHNEGDALNLLDKNPDYVYPRISLEEVRAEIEKSRKQELEQASGLIQASIDAQQKWIPHDFPSDSDPNTVQDIISTFFSDTEFYRRFRNEGNTEWTTMLSKSKAIYNDSNYNQLPICLQMVNKVNGYGYRNWRDGQVHYMAEMMSCSIAIHWGWLTMCPALTEGLKDVYNIFDTLFYSNYDFAASRGAINSFSNSQNYPPLHSFNGWLAGKGHVMYDFYGSYFNGSQTKLDFVNNNILITKQWPETGVKYDHNGQEIETVNLIDEDMDKKYGEMIPWNGGIYLKPMLKHYGLMVQHLRYKWRKIIVDFIEENWKDKFIIAYHIQMGNKKDTFAVFVPEITGSLTALLGNDNGVISIENKNIIVYISTDAGSGDLLDSFMTDLKDKIGAISVEGYDISVLLRDEERLEFGNGDHMAGKQKYDTQEKCIDVFSNVQIDAELLGLADILVLPTLKSYGSTYTRLSRALMMKRHKTICRFTSKTEYSCKNFESKVEKIMNL